MKTFFTLLSFLIFLVASAQKRKTFKVNPGQKIVDAIPRNEMYTYSDFSDGTVYLRDDKYSTAKLNYNALLSEMQFIAANSDTLSLADENTIRSVVVKNDTFYFDKFYLKLVGTYGEVKLANRQYFALTNRQKIGGLGETTDASIIAYDAINTGTYLRDLVAKEIITLSKYSVFYIGDQFNHFELINKKNLLDKYPEKESAIRNYLKKNKVNFSSEDDLKKMLTFLEKE